MSFFKSLFGRAKPNADDGKGIEEHMEFLNSLRESGIGIVGDGAGFSKIGGLPQMPADLAWPEWKDSPLAFLCQLDLAEIPGECSRYELPEDGLVYFFYNQKQDTWGFDPNDKGSWRVLHSNSPASECSEREAPKGLKKHGLYSEKHVAFCPIQTYPDWQDERINSLNMNDKQSDEYADLCTSALEDAPCHQLFGYPVPVQNNDMDLECQLASNGLYLGDPSGYKDERAKELEAGRSEWRMLLQLDTDNDTDMMFGDAGMVYFWIRKEDLRSARFEDCWMILQCY